MFNTLKYAKMLEDTGFSREQAETSVGILVEIMEDKLATKQDMKDLESSVRQDMKDLESSVRQDMKGLESSLRQDMKDLESSVRQDMKGLESSLRQELKGLETAIARMELKLTVRMGAMFAAWVAIQTAIQKLL